MKRTVLFLTCFCFFTLFVLADPVDQKRALQIAKEFVPKSSAVKKAPKKGDIIATSNIVYTHKMPKSGRDAFYIVNVGDAFVLVSADDVAHQILGYSFDKGFPVAADGTVQLPPHVKGFFDDLAAQMEAAIEAEPNRTADDDWTEANKAARRTPSNLPESVAPLLTTTWDQGQYYNALCPEDANGPDGHVLTGCVATAMAQIINYWGEPVRGRGIHSYESNYGTLEVNFAESNYDFSNMPDALTGESTTEQVNAVAKLMYDCGVAVNMGYAAVESAAFDQEARAAFINFFRFSPDLSFAEKAYFSNDEWNNLLRQNLAANQPVYYCGQGTGGHAFVCDGYKADDYYHFNFGWGGFADGWFQTSAVSPNGSDYNSSQSAIVDIVPDNTGNVILGQMQGTSTFVVDEPLEFYHLMGHNKYEGSNYNNPCNNIITFLPANNENQLVTDIIEFEDQTIGIYDGYNASVQMRSLTGGGVNDLSPVVSTQNGITTIYNGNMFYAGFELILSQNSNCRMVSNITPIVDATTIQLAWIENGTATQWQVEYGEKGFTIGEGKLLSTNTNMVTINNLKKFTDYDLYIRPVYDNYCYGPWRGIAVTIEAPYWQDVVISEPQGINYNFEDNVIEISTAEGFAWLTKNDDIYSNICLKANIDLSGYKWKPVKLYGKFEGQGYTISNAYINEMTDDVGFFSSVQNNAIIDNVGLINSQVNGYGNRTGGWCGSMYGTIRNSYVANSLIKGKDYVGGIAGANGGGKLINSYSNVDVTGNRWTGLLIGFFSEAFSGTGATISNCYATGKIKMYSFCYNAGIAAYATDGVISNCYSVKTSMGVVGYKGETIISDTATFVKSVSELTLQTPVHFDDVIETDLLSALNRGIQLYYNDSIYNVWTEDVDNINNGYPVFGKKFEVNCSNVSDIAINNIQKNGINAVSIKWGKNDDANKWIIRYRRYDKPDTLYTYFSTDVCSDTIYGIPPGFVYDFNVRALGNNGYSSGWSVTRTFIVDMPYWTDIVYKQPNGYSIDNDGNIYISTAEGLAWLSVVVNGFHDQQQQTLEGKKVTLTSDINLEGYRWFPIGRYIDGKWTGFSGAFDGNGHSIKGLYINDAWSGLGLFGHVDKGRICNIIIEGGIVSCIYSDTNDFHTPKSSAVGGLIGYATDCYEITNCHSSATIYALGSAGSLCGLVDTGILNNGIGNKTQISNCSSSGDVYGRQACGGLIGEVYSGDAKGDIVIRNCYSTGNIHIVDSDIQPWYRGGLIGFLLSAKVFNCYSTGTVSIDQSSQFYGKVIGGPYLNTCIHNVYGLDNINEGWNLIGDYCPDYSNYTQFHHEGPENALSTNVVINGTAYSSLHNALNAWVVLQNDQGLRLWSLDANSGYPVFSENYVPTCYNPSEFEVSQATQIEDSIVKTMFSWSQVGEPNYWEIAYVSAGQTVDSATIIKVTSNPCVITDIPIGKPLDFYVRAVNNKDDISFWSDCVTYIPDKLRWTEVVTSQPEGYHEDNNGNVYISTAEGLAWLASVVNGINGMQYDSWRFLGKTIELIADIDLSAYRWVPIGTLDNYIYATTFNGNGHSILGLYCNELADYQGLFGFFQWGDISNVTLKQCHVYGESNVGSIAGYAMANINNCTIDGYIYGSSSVGGIVGRLEGFEGKNHGLSNSCFRGIVAIRSDIAPNNTSQGEIGGLVGQIRRVTLNNCYVLSEIGCDKPYSGILTGTGTSDANSIYNCYYKEYQTSLPITHGSYNTANITSFSGNESTWTLNTPQYINGAFHSDLVDALNAWVDANNTEGQYRHWVADTENVNGGFPVFAPAYTLTYKVDGEVYKTSSLEVGAALTPEAAPTKEGYTFSGWSEIPETMPDSDVVVTGYFTINKYQVKFVYEDKIVKVDSVEYGATIPLPTSLNSERYTLIEWLDVPETMPAHDVVIYASVVDGILTLTDEVDYKIYNDRGLRILQLQRGLNIIKYSNGRIRKVIVK